MIDSPSSSPTLSFNLIPHTPLQWLWHPYIPLGKITLLIGDPGSAKSLLALHLAAQLSNAKPIGPRGIGVPPMNPQTHGIPVPPMNPKAAPLRSEISIPQSPISNPQSQIPSAPTLLWEPNPLALTPDQLSHLKPPLPAPSLEHDSQLQSAITFLQKILADGPIKATQLNEDAAANLISDGTLRRAREALNLIARKSHYNGTWYWSLPSDPRPIPNPLDLSAIDKKTAQFLATFGQVRANP